MSQSQYAAQVREIERHVNRAISPRAKCGLPTRSGRVWTVCVFTDRMGGSFQWDRREGMAMLGVKAKMVVDDLCEQESGMEVKS